MYWIVSLSSSITVAYLAFFQSNHFAVGQQIQPDNTLGSNITQVEPNATINGLLITGGAVSGANLFHSFQDFGVGSNQNVYFNNPGGIDRIIARVIGRNRSEILGTLGVFGGNADLFLINPNGIIFGPNATLDLNGSFIATTASSLIFSDSEYSAIDPSPPILSMQIPIGLQFRGPVGQIINQAKAVNFFDGGLRVEPGKTIALIGGDVLLDGGFIGAFGGNVELGSVTLGQVNLQLVNRSWIIGYENIAPQNFGDINLLQMSAINISSYGFPGEAPGSVNLQGRNIKVADGSRINALTFSDLNPAGTIKISASNSFELIGVSPINQKIKSGLFTSSVSGNQNSGSIIIDAKKVLISDRAIIQVSSSGIEISPGIFDTSSGKGGNVTITTNQLDISGGAGIVANTAGAGKGGNILINASDSVNIFGVSSDTGEPSSISAISEGNSSGQAGSIKIKTKLLRVADLAQISVSSTGAGSAGNIAVKADSIRLERQGLLSAQTTGGFGNISLNANDIILSNGSNISANATGSGDGGNITINTGVLLGLDNSDIVANALFGSGGRINITAKGVFGFTPLTRDELQQLEPTQLDPGLLPSSDITAISQSAPSLNGQVTLNTTEPDPSEGLVELPTTVVDPRTLVAQNACKRGSESEFTNSGRGGLPANPNQDLSNGSAQVGLVEPASIETKVQTNQSPTVSVNPQQAPEKPIAPAQGWVYNEKGEIVLVAYNPNITSPQRLKDNTACAGK